MNIKSAHLKVILLCLAIFAISRHAQAAQSLNPNAHGKVAACSAPQYQQFNFWIGDWDVFDSANPAAVIARLRVTRILNGCVLQEDYRGADGHEGISFNIYDAATKTWRQTWVTNHGKFLAISGGLENGAMVLKGEDRAADGKKELVQGTWKPVKGGVEEIAVTSTDGGKTWTSWFDILFRPRKHGQSSTR